MARRGVSSCVISLFLLSALPFLTKGDNIAVGVRVMYIAAAFLAFTSATVVNSLTALASLQCDEAEEDGKEAKALAYPELAKGRALGEFRSSGQLGRAIGPLLGKFSFCSELRVLEMKMRLIMTVAISHHSFAIQRAHLIGRLVSPFDNVCRLCSP